VKSPIADSTILVADRDVLAAEFPSEFVLLNVRDGMYYSLEDVGARVWTILQAPIAVGALRDRIAAEYDVDPTRCGSDIASLIGDLVNRGLVELCGDGR
jgi:hypothetical protein